MSREFKHYGVKGMKWKQHIRNDMVKPNFKWKNTRKKDHLVVTDNREQLVNRLNALKKKAGFKTRDISKLTNEMIRLILNSDQLQTKLSQINKAKVADGKRIMNKFPQTLFKTKL